MAVIASSRTVPVPAAPAAAVVLDWSRDPQWRVKVSRMEVEPAGPARVGQRIVEHLRFAGATYVTRTRITEATPTGAASAGGNSTAAVAGTRRIEEVDGGVRITTVLDIALTGVLRPLTRLLAPSYRRIQEADLDRLVALLTAEAPARP